MERERGSEGGGEKREREKREKKQRGGKNNNNKKREGELSHLHHCRTVRARPELINEFLYMCTFKLLRLVRFKLHFIPFLLG